VIRGEGPEMKHGTSAVKDPDQEKGSVLIVGNFCSSYFRTRGVCEDLADRLSSLGWHVIKTSACAPRLTRLLDMTRTAWFRRHQYQLAQVDVFSGPAFVWAEIVCAVLRRARKPYILTLHGGSLPSFAAKHTGRMSRLLGSAAVVTTPSRYLGEQMRPYRQTLLLLPNALDINAYEFNIRKKPEPRLVWLRQFSSQHVYNPVLALRVVEILAKQLPNIKLLMVGSDKGDGSLRKFRALVSELGLADRIALPGGVAKSDVPKWLNKGDIFLNTTNTDNTPVSLMEAMACGLCIVTTDPGGIGYLLDHEDDALLVPRNNPGAMAEAVRRLLNEDGLAERLSGNAGLKAKQFDWSAVLPKWQELLRQVATGRGVAA
jgi:glycosyltransferase involved in cell wall biosynthesis